MSTKLPILYDYYKSSSAYRLRIALALKNIQHETYYVDFCNGEHKSENYLQKVPTGKVPAFTTKDDKTLSQSMAIIEYLEEVYPEKPLLPNDTYQRALVREIAQIIACDIQPLQNDPAVFVVANDKQKQDEFGKYIISKTFYGLEGRLKETAGKYSVGDSITVADVYVAPMVFNAYNFEVDMTQYPILSRLYGTLMEVPEFKEVHPFNREDCPEESRFK